MVIAVTDGSAFTDWLISDNWQDYRQQRAIRELGAEVSSLSSSLYSQQRESSRLRSELSKLQGTVEVRLERLTRSFDAFVELSDLRMTLAMFDPPALVRHRTRQVIAAVSQAEQPPLVDYADVPGYWLAPATAALVALLRGEDAAEQLALANERDEARTALYITLSAAVARRTDLSARWLPKAFGPLPTGEPVTRVVRTLWTEAATGRFGPDGVALLHQRLGELADGLDATAASASAAPAAPAASAVSAAWQAKVDALPAMVPRAQSILDTIPEVEEALAAGAKLTSLRDLCAKPPAEPPAPGDEDPLGAILRALVDEGSAEEAPLLRRAAELRAVIEGKEYTADEQWAAPAGTALDLLLEDAFRPDGTPLARAARAAGARWLLPNAERLAASAAADPPREATTSIDHLPVRVRAGAPPDGLEAVQKKIDSRYLDEPVPTRGTIAIAAVGAVLCLSLIGWPNALAVIATLAGAGTVITAAVRWRREAQLRTERHERKANSHKSARERAERAATELDELRDRLTATGQRATDDLQAVKANFS